jgi:hypothetical protein
MSVLISPRVPVSMCASVWAGCFLSHPWHEWVIPGRGSSSLCIFYSFQPCQRAHVCRRFSAVKMLAPHSVICSPDGYYLICSSVKEISLLSR